MLRFADRVSQIYLRPMDSLEATPIPGTENGANPFFSPDGQWIGFFAGGKLRKFPSAAVPRLLGRCHHSSRATWGSGGVIVFAPTSAGGLQQVSDAGGNVQPLTQFTKRRNHSPLAAVFAGRQIVTLRRGQRLCRRRRRESAGSRLLDERGQTIRGCAGRHTAGLRAWLPGVYAGGNDVDGRAVRRQANGNHWHAVPAVESILQSTPTAAAQYAVSENGSLVYVAGEQTSQRNLVWVSRNGAETASGGSSTAISVTATLARRPAHRHEHRFAGVSSVIYDLTRDALTRLTFDGRTTDRRRVPGRQTHCGDLQ